MTFGNSEESISSCQRDSVFHLFFLFSTRTRTHTRTRLFVSEVGLPKESASATRWRGFQGSWPPACLLPATGPYRCVRVGRAPSQEVPCLGWGPTPLLP